MSRQVIEGYFGLYPPRTNDKEGIEKYWGKGAIEEKKIKWISPWVQKELKDGECIEPNPEYENAIYEMVVTIESRNKK